MRNGGRNGCLYSWKACTYGVLLQLVPQRRAHRRQLRQQRAVLRREGLLLLACARELALRSLDGVEVLVLFCIVMCGVAIAIQAFRRRRRRVAVAVDGRALVAARLGIQRHGRR